MSRLWMAATSPRSCADARCSRRAYRMARAPLCGCMIAALLLTMAAPVVRPEGAVCIENATIGELRQALAAGHTTAVALVQAYLARIAAYDRAGPRLNAVREINPDAPAIAAQSDARESAKRRPLEGIPIL